MTVAEMIVALQHLQANGHGESPVRVNQYDGGDDAPCDVIPEAPAEPDDPVMLRCYFVRN